ncbi:MAG TPA: hypothetical protein VG537_11710 [Candidatus Kapabacteria bacterium]|nr:hypothetical protein [Candidatus Kapabacteria bacterium]
MTFSIMWRHRPHIVIGASSLVAVLSILTVLVISGKSRKALANRPGVIELTMPDQSQMRYLAELQAYNIIHAASLSSSANENSEQADSVIQEALSGRAGRGAVSPAVYSTFSKLTGVMLTPELSDFAEGLTSYLTSQGISVTITSGVRSGERQLELVKQRIAAYGMMSAFPGLTSASLEDKSAWAPAWEWLKAHHIPVDPPADFVDNNGNVISSSLHLKGLAIDLVAGNLDVLSRAIVRYANSGLEATAAGELRMTGITRERDCVHIALTH